MRVCPVSAKAKSTSVGGRWFQNISFGRSRFFLPNNLPKSEFVVLARSSSDLYTSVNG